MRPPADRIWTSQMCTSRCRILVIATREAVTMLREVLQGLAGNKIERPTESKTDEH